MKESLNRSVTEGCNWNESRLSRRPSRGPRTWLDKYNNYLAEEDAKTEGLRLKTLHPTKGYRYVSLKRKGIF